MPNKAFKEAAPVGYDAVLYHCTGIFLSNPSNRTKLHYENMTFQPGKEEYYYFNMFSHLHCGYLALYLVLKIQSAFYKVVCLTLMSQ